jgi:hypothetical protein
MAEKTQINPKLSPGTYATFQAYCKEHGRTHSDVVEAALEAWFTPSGMGTDAQMILDKLREQETGFQKQEAVLKEQGAVLKKLVEGITKLLTQQATPPPLPVAGPDVLYAGWQKPVASTVEEKGAPEEPAPTTDTGQEEAPPVKRRVWFGWPRRDQ